MQPGDDLVVRKNGRVRILNKVFERHRALAARAKANDGSVQRKQRRPPVSARVSLGQRAADGSLITHLHVGNPGGTVVKEGNRRTGRGMFKVRVPDKRPDV